MFFISVPILILLYLHLQKNNTQHLMLNFTEIESITIHKFG